MTTAESRISVLEEKIRRLEQERDAALAQVQEKESENHFREAFAHAPVGMTITDPEGHFLEVNAAYCRMIGYDARELVPDLTFKDITHPDDLEKNLNEWRRLMAGEIPAFFFEKRYVRRDGKILWVRTSVTTRRDSLGKPLQVVAIIEDFTQRKQMEEAVRIGEQRLEMALESAQMGVWELKLGDKSDWRTLEHDRIFGYDSLLPEWTYEIFLDHVLPEDREEVNQKFKAAISSSKDWHFNCRIQRADGAVRWIEAQGRKYPGEKGRKGRIIGLVADITERQRTEAALRESEERFRVLMEASAQAVWETNPGGVPVKDQSVWRAYTGQTEEDFFGDGWVNAVHPEDREFAEREWREAVAAERNVDLEFRLRSPGGRWRWTHVHSAPIRDAAGHILKWVGMNIDITDRKEAEEALRASEEKFRAVFEKAATGMGRVRFSDGSWIDVNDALCRMLGYSPEQMRATPWPQITHPEDLDLDLIPFRRMAAGELDNYSVEKRFVHKDGHHAWARLTLSLVRDSQGQPDYEIAVIENIVERKQAEQAIRDAKTAAEEASRAKGEFLATMSHEIRTPMTIFMAAIEHLLQIDRHPERRHLLGMADQSARRLRCLIDDILDFSRIESRKVDIEDEPFDLRNFVREAVHLFDLPAREKNLRLEMDVAPDVPQIVVGDPDRLGQVFTNLIGNAVKFTREGEIRVRVQLRKQLVEFAVIDTGIGIPEEKHARLFESFSQVDASSTRQYGGTGLGLAISKGLVELMGGEIFVQNRQGEGSVFTFTLPLKTRKHLQAAETAQDVPIEKPPGARILVAEDDPMIQELITLMLASKGWQVDIAETGREALQKWEGGRFDLILMDMQMPEMSGMEATRIIREKESENEKRTCIIGLTAHALREVKEDCLRAGMDRVLTKPVQIKELYSALDACLSK